MVQSFYNPSAAASRFWNPYTQTMPREQLDAWHLRRIQLLIKHAYDNTPFYRRLYDQKGVKPEDIRTWDDYYHKIPFTDKPYYVQDQEGKDYGVAALPKEYFAYDFRTTGTTGVPLREVFSLFDMARLGDQYLWGLWDSGARPGDSIYFCFDFGFWIGFWGLFHGMRRYGLTCISGAGLSSQDRIKQILALRPAVVTGTPTYFLHMADVSQQMGLDLREAGVRVLVAGGEAGFNIPATRKAVVEVWGCESALDLYGIGELGLVNNECGAHPGGVHMSEDGCHSYSTDPKSGEPVGEGQVGENVITSFTHTTQPFIKYKTHDMVRRYKEFDHGCGWTWDYLEGGVLGRSDFMVVIRGVNVYPTAVENLLGQVKGLSHYHELHVSRESGMDRMLVKVEAETGVPVDTYPEFRQRTEAMYRDIMGLRLEVEVTAPGSLPRYQLKSTRVFDHRPKEVRRELER